jgi:hypothetical protein
MECSGIYANKKIYNNLPLNELTKTWKYTRHFQDHDIECANLYCNGKQLDEVCPEHLKEDWHLIVKKMKAFLLSFSIAKISLDDYCFYEMVPEKFLLEYFHIKDEICKHIFETFEKPQNYDHLYQLSRVIEQIGVTELNIDEKPLRKFWTNIEARNFSKRLQGSQKVPLYNIFGSKTGRLTTKEGSFPILTMNKKFRGILKPNNDLFLELDFNAAELRTLLSLSGQKQPQEDLHIWNAKNIFAGAQKISRQKSKKNIFSWLYDPKSTHRIAESIYDRKKVKAENFDGTHVRTVFGRTIEADNHHALNYIVQSTTADMVLAQMVKLNKLLKGKKSHIAFCLHDSVTVDLHGEDKQIIPELINVFKKTALGDFLVNVKAGKNFGEMRKIDV